MEGVKEKFTCVQQAYWCEVKPWSQGWLIAAGAYPGFCSMKRLEVFLLPLDGMLVHRRSLPRNFVRFPQQIAGTHLYTWVERGTVRVKCLAQEHNTLSPARARTRSARSGVERTNHEAYWYVTEKKRFPRVSSDPLDMNSFWIGCHVTCKTFVD